MNKATNIILNYFLISYIVIFSTILISFVYIVIFQTTDVIRIIPSFIISNVITIPILLISYFLTNLEKIRVSWKDSKSMFQFLILILRLIFLKNNVRLIASKHYKKEKNNNKEKHM